MSANYRMRVIASGIDEALETAEREYRKLLGDEPTFTIVIDDVEPEVQFATNEVLAWRFDTHLKFPVPPAP